MRRRAACCRWSPEAEVAPVSAERYTVEHDTRYVYRTPVAQSWQLAHLTPRALPWQRVLSHELRIEPRPDERRDALDSFGNAVTHFSLHAAHESLDVAMRCVVEVGERPGIEAAASIGWEAVRDALRNEPAQDGLLPARMTEPTRLVPSFDAASLYAAASFGRGRDWFGAVSDLMHRIHAEFEFEPGSTTVSTSIDEVLYQRSGVCQD